MKRKVFVSFGPLLIIATFAVTPATAQAAPHWKKNGTTIAAGSPTPVLIKSTGKFTFKWKRSSSSPLTTTKCRLLGKDTILNPTGGGAGEDFITAFELKSCKSLPKFGICATLPIEIRPGGTFPTPPWASELLAGSPITDQIKAIQLEVLCHGTLQETFEGTLMPEVVPGFLNFTSTTGELEEATSGEKTTVEDVVVLHAPPGKIEAG